MARLSNTFEGGTNNTAITTGNSGGTSGDNFDFISTTGTLVYTNTTPAHGSLAAKITPASGSAATFQYGSGTNVLGSSSLAVRACVRLDSLPPDTNPLVYIGAAGGTRIASVNIDSSGKFLARDSTGTAIATGTASAATGTWYTIEMYVKIGASTEAHWRVYAGDDNSVFLLNQDATTANTGTANVQAVSFGKYFSGTWATDQRWDDVLVDTAATSYIGPYGSAAPLGLSGVVTPSSHIVGAQQTLTLTATGGNANPKTYSVTWDGTAMGPQTSNVFTKTDTTAGTKNWTATVAQNA